MSTTKKIIDNTLWQVVLRAINIVLGVISLALVTRLLGQAGFGFYTTITAFVQTFMILADLGLYLSLLRAIGASQDKEEESKIINNVFTIRLFSAILILCLVPVVIRFFPYELIVKNNVIYILLAFLLQSLISTLTAVFAKHLAMPRAAIVDLFNKIIYLSFLIYLFNNHGSLAAVLWVQSLAALFSFVLFLIFIWKYTKLKLAWDFGYWRRIFSSAWPLAITVILNLVYFKADTLILSAYHSPEQVGLYGAAYRVLEVLTTFPHMFMSLILPLFTAAWVSQNTQRLKGIWQNTFDFFCMVTVGFVSITWLSGRAAMSLLAGSAFAAAGDILNVLILATAAIFFGTLYTYLVVALDVQKQMIKYFLLTAVVGLVGYFLFIPRWSYWGAAYMTLLVELMVWFLAYRLVQKKLSLQVNYKILAKSLLAGLLTLLVVWPLRQQNVLYVLLIASLLYLLVLYLFKAIKKEFIKELFRR